MIKVKLYKVFYSYGFWIAKHYSNAVCVYLSMIFFLGTTYLGIAYLGIAYLKAVFIYTDFHFHQLSNTLITP